MRRFYQGLCWGLFLLLFVSCVKSKSAFLSEETAADGFLSQKTLELNASLSSMKIQQGRVITDNDEAFRAKLVLVENAKQSIDLAYYLYADDYSSSVLSKALIEAAKRGVQVRMLVDLQTNYKNLDLFSMMEKEGGKGSGSLKFRFYNRPTKNIVKDAVFLTMGCGEVSAENKKIGCGAAKFEKIDRLFREEKIDGKPVGDKNISNLNIEKSGLFLSGLYSKNPNLMVTAAAGGQEIDLNSAPQGGGENLAQLKRLGKIYWQSRFGSGLNRLSAKVQLALAFAFYGEAVNPVFEAFTAYFPVERQGGGTAAEKDWRFLTDFLHHKILWVDETHLQLGGRNIEDSYHMAPNPLTRKYVFMDTDVNLTFSSRVEGLTRSFDRLWHFDAMVADIGEIRRFAPNDFLMMNASASKTCESVKNGEKAVDPLCYEVALKKEEAKGLEGRMADRLRNMLGNARIYRNDYQTKGEKSAFPSFSIDSGADIYYVENVPFYRPGGGPREGRSYGAENGREGEHGKHIHRLWLSALRHVCKIATPENPQQIVLHNAYFFLPSNILNEFGAMIDGRRDCGHVHVKILTNSIETTDLNVVNIFSRHSIKAFTEYGQHSRDVKKAATFSFYEYIPQKDAENLSLHTKVEIFGSDIFIGSANADVRSYMMDSNNGLFIRNANRLVKRYSLWIEKIMADASRVKEVTSYYLHTSREKMLEEDRATLGQIMEKYRAERWIKGEAQVKALEQRFMEILNLVYQLSVESLKPCRFRCDGQRKFNMLFKAI